MGAAGSVQSNEADPASWWSPRSSSQHLQSHVLEQGETHVNSGDKDNEVIAMGEELWLKQIQDLGKIIENLASENIKLLNSNKELKHKCEEQERRQEERENHIDNEKESHEDPQIMTHLQEESAKDKKLIEDLKLQLQTNDENSAVEVEKYHESLNFMQMKVKEYEQAVEKLEKDAEIQNNAIQSLQNILMCSEDQGKATDQSAIDMKVTIEALRQEHKNSEEENKSLKEHIETEMNMRKKTDDENQKLLEELKQLKQHKMDLNTTNRTSENTDTDTSETCSGELDQPSTSSDSNRNEEARTLSPRAAAELEVFQTQLKVKREARHKALSAISMEMERLRRELNTEREARQNTVRELENVKSLSDTHEICQEINDLKHKLSFEQQEKDRIHKEMIQIQKEGNEEIENILKDLEKEKAKTLHALGENKVMKEQLEESDQMLQLQTQENHQLQSKLETDREKYQQQVLALKDVVAISKEMLTVRENQVTHLKQTLQDIEASVIQKHRGSLTAGLRAEYETQMENIKALKALYEERTLVMNAEKERLITEQKELQRLIEDEKRIVETLELKIKEKEEIISERNATVSDLQDQLSDAIDQSRNLSHELTLINNMFTQILGSNDMDLDRLTKLLQENHDLITEITTKGDCSDTTASLPKLLLDLVCHAENSESNSSEQDPQRPNDNSPDVASTTMAHEVNKEATGQTLNVNSSGAPLAMQDISSNLPKVWKVLLELVSHHVPSPTEESSEDSKTSCYKSIDTPYGPKNVISVSKTFIRLRDLILQKKCLQKEVTRLKQLNIHLETKLSDQERRLSLVSTELRKTWNVVDHMRVQHQQLHTHEKVLRYELQQKRKLLNELKEELEYCREKWEDARQKNSQSETEWQKLRKEFALRKSKPLNNSGESGFSEEKDEDGSDGDVTKIQGQLCQGKSFSDSLNNLHHSVCSNLTVLKSEDAETVNTSATSLPDLVSVAADLPLPPSDVQVSIGMISTNDVSNEVNGDSIPLLQNIVQEALSLENGNNDSVVLEHSVLEECSTVSLITLLKQELSCFSKNLEIITAEFDTKALQSIFSLPAIQIPDHLNPVTDEISTSILKIDCNSDSTNRTPVNRGITRTGCESKAQREDSQNCSEGKERTLQLQQEIMSDSLDTTTFHDISPLSEAEGQEHNKLGTLRSTEDLGNVNKTNAHSNTENTCDENRSHRIQRLEQQCQQLFNKLVTGKSNSTGNTGHSAEPKQPNRPKNNQSEPTRDLESMLDARAARLKRLEEQSQQLFKQVKRTTNRSAELSNRLEELHEQYGTDDTTTDETFSQNISSDPCASNVPDTSGLFVDHALSEQPVHDKSPCTATYHPAPSTSTHIPNSASEKDELAAGAACLKILEEQSQLFRDVKTTTNNSSKLSNQMEELHEHDRCEDVEENVIVSACSSNNSQLGNTPKSPLSDDHLLPSNSKQSEKSPVPIPVQENEALSPLPSTSTNIPITLPLENVLDARAARLKRLEEQSQQLFRRVKRTTNRSAELSNRLEELHEQYNGDSSGNPVRTCANTISESQSLSDCMVSLKPSSSASPHCNILDQPEVSSLSISSASLNNIPIPPPLPSVLPSTRLPTEMFDELNTEPNNVRIQDMQDDIEQR